MSGFIKGLSALAVVFVTYVDKTLSPLFWVLIGLVALDLLLNMHHENKQLQKLGSAFFAIGVPSVADNAGHIFTPDTLKVMVALMCLSYIQLIWPQLLTLLKKLGQGKNAILTSQEEKIAQEAANLMEQRLQQIAQKQAGQTPTTPASPATSIQDATTQGGSGQ